MGRFIDDVSVLAIEDCLIGKLSTLFRSGNVLQMTEPDLSRLAGETPESSLERKRLKEKLRILETGLQGLKTLHKRRNVGNPFEQDHVPREDPERLSAMTPSRSEKASTASGSAVAAPWAISPVALSPPYEVPAPPPAGEWPTRVVEQPLDEPARW